VLEIDGHTDSIGRASYNEALSQRRAQSVSSYLSSKGFDSNKLKAVGYGESDPIASNLKKSGRAKNRRIEFIVKGVR
jgi:OOP family OmpA-OmpF porin